ncbi:MAG: carboxylating nicotinate-nucleotide diphosphorylase [Candidatus Omnitrophica bacterium]|nr:carboxylating nicotinate-nucleotide diphosphorylase [Candidatus Omnitrophota bacterium]
MMHFNKKIITSIKMALQEDIGRVDITTLFTIPYHFKIKSVLFAKEDGILCGIDVAKRVFFEKSRNITFKALKKDGETFKKGEKIALISGDARIILSCERVALNFLSLLSGIASNTRQFVEKVKGSSTKILDTRKTTPNLRVLEKYAVRTGGGTNHRSNLQDAILMKDNHLRAGKFIRNGVFDVIRMAKCISYLRTLAGVKLEIEVEELSEFKGVIKYAPDVIMLDNFTVPNLKKAVVFRNKYYPTVKLEASGGINLSNVSAVAKTGVDFISIGSITHSPKAIDFSLEVLDG